MLRIGITERGDAAIHLDEWLANHHRVDGVILVTKNPSLLLTRASDIPWHKCVTHCTITGWGNTPLEPGVPPADQSLAAYDELRSRLGGERVVLRIDPIIPTDEGIRRATEVRGRATGRVRISFLDFYRHLWPRLRAAGEQQLSDQLRILYKGDLHAPLRLRQELAKRFGRDVEICGEPGMSCAGCVSLRDIQAMGLPPPDTHDTSRQRKACACLASKTELLGHRSRCAHQCLYCYWR